MKLPATVDIGPWTYTVSDDEADIDAASDDMGEELFAFIDHSSLVILLEPSQDDDQKRDSLLHEVMHGVAAVAAVDQDIEPEELEKLIRRMATGLLDMLRRNPAVVEYLTAE